MAKSTPRSNRKRTARTRENAEVLWVYYGGPSRSGRRAHEERFGGRSQLPVDRLGTLLQEFTERIGRGLTNYQQLPGAFRLAEITLEAELDAEVGFVLIGKAGLKGSVSLKFMTTTTQGGGPRGLGKPPKPGWPKRIRA